MEGIAQKDLLDVTFKMSDRVMNFWRSFQVVTVLIVGWLITARNELPLAASYKLVFLIGLGLYWFFALLLMDGTRRAYQFMAAANHEMNKSAEEGTPGANMGNRLLKFHWSFRTVVCIYTGIGVLISSFVAFVVTR